MAVRRKTAFVLRALPGGGQTRKQSPPSLEPIIDGRCVGGTFGERDSRALVVAGGCEGRIDQHSRSTKL